ncbi:MAG: cysteine--tRNA ligase [Candidatus Levybacteria bacterium RIFCSPLOWO2_02_FULL_36_8b]|nr:MAG: cysteine--tRNA ligase [Candidatus Levybacteria bacterium RIFCSPLOWO2_02_FULL_36_8b]
MLKLYNSLTKKKELFRPIKPKNVSLYVCGITPYDTTHLGHAFTYISFDILVRFLIYKGYVINYTQNVTDINDRDNDILQKAEETNTSWQKLAEYWTEKFLNDMKVLNWIMPNNYLKASESIGKMIVLINKLLSNKFAYEKNGSVYFDISKKKDFGKLSAFDRIQMLKIAKEFDEDTGNPDKKNSLDITLWRATNNNQPAHIPSFLSPFGKGRPGWHIECSAMATKTLGEQIDIHGGGIDLIYPHHEAEIAQSEGATSKTPFARFWLHVAQVAYQGKKMSKSLGNLVMISDLLKKYSANAIRWYLISHHYRQPWEFFEKDIEKANIEFSQILDYNTKQKLEVEFDENIFNKFINALNNDLNTPLALQIIKSSPNKKMLSTLGFSNF